MIWAWERPEDLSYIDKARCGVAFLAARIRLDRQGASIFKRKQMLRLPEGAYREAVVRIDTAADLGAPGLARQVEWLADEIAAIARLPGIGGIQIDFDAREKEREFYRLILQSVRRRIDPDLTLSITALASWCLGDRWLDGLAVDEVVPMFFRMGADSRWITTSLQSGASLGSGACRSCLGLSVDEPQVARALKEGGRAILSPTRRVYLFSPSSWRKQSVAAALEEIGSK